MDEQKPRFSHYAILIGIDAYSKLPLDSCVRDVLDIEKYLERMPNPVHIQMLTATKDSDCSRPAEDPNFWPTYDNVASSLKQVTSLARAGDFVYVHFSGHGTTREPLKDASKVSIEGITLVPAECSNPSTGDLALVLVEATTEIGVRYLYGKQLASLIKIMVDKGLIITLVLDCCFSGSVMRDDTSVRYLKYDPRVDAAYPPPSKLDPGGGASRTVYRNASMRSNWLVDPDGYTIITACGPTEITKEIVLDGLKHGALSYLLLKTLDNFCDTGFKQRYFYLHLCASFREAQERNPEKRITNPMFYGNKTLGFFGHTSPGDDALPISVIEKRDGGFQLEAGEAHGICDGDEFAMYPLSSAHNEFTSEGDLMTAKAAHVRALVSDLEFLNTTSSHTETGWIAIALTRLTLRKFPVRLELSVPYPKEWARALQDRPSLDIYDVDHIKPGFPFSFYVAVLGHNSYEIRDGSNQPISSLPALAADSKEKASHILDVIEHLVKFKMVRNLANKSLADPAHSFGKSFSVQLVNPAGKMFHPGCLEAGWFSPGCSHPECLVEAEDGEKLELIVQNRGEKEDNALHLHLYDMGPYWEIENTLMGNHVVIPPRNSNQHMEFPQGGTGRWNKKLKFNVPAEMRETRQYQCDDVIKIFLTLQLTSFWSLELAKLGKSIKRGGISRSREGGGQSSEEWAALNFRVRTRVKNY